VLGHDQPLESDRGIANVGERDWGAPSNAPDTRGSESVSVNAERITTATIEKRFGAPC